MNKTIINTYNPKEEKLNIYSHFLGIILSTIGLILLLNKSILKGDKILMISYAVFGISMITLYLASTLYHSATDTQKRMRLKIFDHSAIYVLIAGSYTPYTLVTLKDNNGIIVFAIVWIFALIGLIIKFFFTGKFKLISTLMYVFMGWMIVFTWTDLKNNLSEEGLNFLIAGGISYTIGAILYSIKKIPFNHAIFHLFVLIGTFFHFLSIYLHIN